MMKNTYLAGILFLILGIFFSCEQVPTLDTQPPQLMSTVKTPEGNLILKFNEPLDKVSSKLNIPAQELPSQVSGAQVSLSLPTDLEPGKPYQYTVEAQDKNGNLTTLSGSFYGKNPNPVQLSLSEVRIAGSGTKPDAIELVSLTEGHLGGLVLECYDYSGSCQTKVFPDVNLPKGSYIVLHCKPQGIADEKDEIDGPDQSGGYEVRPDTWDFWVEEGKGLSGTTGLIVLKDSPDGAVQDLLPWTNKPGAGLKLIPEGEAPQLWGDGELNPANCTTTRTWCRVRTPTAWGLPVGSSEWMLVNTSCATMGYANKLTPYKASTASVSIAAN